MSFFEKQYKQSTEKIFYRYKKIFNNCKNAKYFHIIIPIKKTPNKIFFEFINIKYSFAERFKGNFYNKNDLIKLGKILAEFHILNNKNYNINGQGLLHGDFGGGNIVIDNENNYHIIDCEAPIDNTGPITGYYYYDISRILLFLRLQKPIRKIFSLTNNIEENYIKGYEEISKEKINKKKFNKYYFILLGKQIKYSFINKQLLNFCKQLFFYIIQLTLIKTIGKC